MVPVLSAPAQDGNGQVLAMAQSKVVQRAPRDSIAQPSAPDLYERDVFAWTQQQADLLRCGNLAHLDRVNLLEEVETLGRKEVAELRSRLRVLAAHLLKTVQPPHLSGRSWQATILVQRLELEQLIGDNPSLKSRLAVVFAEAYAAARKLAAAETGLAITTFPAHPPFTPAQALDQGWLPPAVPSN
jgi:hypothetical protein